MATKKIALAYCIDNLPVAESLYKALSQTSYSVSHYYCKKNAEEATLAEQLRDFDGTILLLISDNFLRSEHCMNRALQLVQQKTSNILPLVIDGRNKDEASGQWVNTPTKFERIGDIIPYINYWQNKYLDLRSQKRKFEAENEADKREELNENLRILRQVSSEASEFLRVLRNMRYYQFGDFIENHMRAFFEFVEDSAEWSAFKSNVPNLNFQDDPSAEVDTEVAVGTTELPTEPALQENPIAELFQENEIEARPEEPELVTEKPSTMAEPGHELAENLEEWTGAELAENLEDLGVVIAEHASTALEEIPLEIPALEPEIGTIAEANINEVVEPETAEVAVTHTDAYLDTPDADAHEDSSSEVASSDETDDDNDDEVDEEESNDKVSDLIREARGLVASGQVEAGINYMKQAIKIYPGSAEMHYFYGLILAQNTRDLNGALEQLALATEIDPDHEAAFFLLGELSELQGDFNAARKHYERLIDINDEFTDVHYRLGTVLQAHFPEDVEYAAKCFKKAAKRNPGNADAHYQYASILADVMGKTTKAEEWFLKTLEIQSKHPFANYDLALIYHTAGDAAKALEYYEAAIANNPELQTPENEIAFRGLGTPTEPEVEAIEEEVPTAIEDSVADEEPVALEEIAGVVEEISAPPLSPLLSIEHDTIEALKQNILRLEELLKAKAAQVEEAVVEEEPIVEEPFEMPPAKTALITGATSGIGLATARTFAQAGWRLILTGRREDRLEAVKAELMQAGAEVLGLVFDVRDYHKVAENIQNLPEEWRSIDLLMNNAGKAKGLSEIQEGSLEHWEEMIDTNIKGLLYLTRCVSPMMVAQHRGHIINIGSIAGKEPYPMGNVYCASKAAVDMLTRTMRLDLHKYNIRVSQIAPGHVEETEFALVRFDGDADRAKIYNDFQPLTSQDVANTIYYMATQPSHVNIQDVVIYGTQQASATVIDRSGRP
ncbi:MAG: SDR family NAD(P)-dependent oxidoreductase [Haliscomenobacter sp.]|uniref:SDR family NAD(P)-dependent oxidoreductase n=1 Tax=Haliscomenobacter sp. TaxID=2717303 RepID=UPI0029B2AE0D|nr:SDR family NAD(P)-dependent oxidoreductase [Haliscomenobacter sp.]MDX2069818.1 SDR family NAD(P)-dependent oxidoreductase [Haliscomenobacter sp.]